ncbi:MAG: OmpA family protein [Opitutaceae bacterium]|nr:OmpA family protein [Opitutaceae bacterium]
MAGGGGGAWKVAYADFVTAMMALFMVLWISAQDKRILIATSQYFQNPFNSPMDNTSGVLPFNSDKTTQSQGEDQGEAQNNNKQIEMSFLNSVAAEFYRLLHLDRDMADQPIDIQVTSDGLRVTLFDRARQPLFVDQTAEFTEWGRFVMQGLAWLIDRHRFGVTIDGHTRAGMPLIRDDYGGWELSSDRANAARRSLVFYAVDTAQIERVTGYADTRPMPSTPPEAESNQRITLSLTLTGRSRPSAATAAAPPKS